MERKKFVSFFRVHVWFGLQKKKKKNCDVQQSHAIFLVDERVSCELVVLLKHELPKREGLYQTFTWRKRPEYECILVFFFLSFDMIQYIIMAVFTGGEEGFRLLVV